MIYKEVSYSLKIWFSTIVVAPIIFLVVDRALTGSILDEPMSDWYEYIVFYFGLIVIGGFFSTIIFAIFLLIVKVTVTYSGSVSQCKRIISGSGFLLSMGTFGIPSYLFERNFRLEIFYVSASYAICTVWFSWFYELATEENQTTK